MRVDVDELYEDHLPVQAGSRCSNNSLNFIQVSSFVSVLHRVRDDCWVLLLFDVLVRSVIVIGGWSEVILHSDTTCIPHTILGCDVIAGSMTDSKYGCDVLMCVYCFRDLW